MIKTLHCDICHSQTSTDHPVIPVLRTSITQRVSLEGTSLFVSLCEVCVADYCSRPKRPPTDASLRERQEMILDKYTSIVHGVYGRQETEDAHMLRVRDILSAMVRELVIG